MSTSMVAKDSKHIIREKARSTLQLINKSCKWLEGSEEGGRIMSLLTSLRVRMRDTDDKDLNPIAVFAPYLLILRTSRISGPLMLAAADAVEVFLSCNVLVHNRNVASDVLDDIIDALTRCRFTLTEAKSDELVQLQLIHVLHTIVQGPYHIYLSDEAAWRIVSSSHTVLLSSGQQGIRTAQYQSSEKLLLDTVRLVFSCCSNTSSTATSPYSFGLPCGMKILGHFVGSVDRFTNLSAGSVTQLDTEVHDLHLSLRVLQSIMWADGTLEHSRTAILHCSPMASLVRDDLSRCLVLIASSHQYPTSVLQLILSLFETLFASFGPTIKILTECFFSHVYLKALHRLSHTLKNQYSIAPVTNGSSSPSLLPATPLSYSIDEVELILESLLDFVSCPGILPTLYMSFDCDPTKPDIVRMLFEYLATCACYSLSCTAEDGHLGIYKMSTGIAVQCVQRIALTLCTSIASREGSIEQQEAEDEVRQRWGVPLSDVPRGLSGDMRYKYMLQEAARRFSENSLKGLLYLQSEGYFGSRGVIEPRAVARFLRIAPNLPKEVAGAYLGELGKDHPSYECYSKEFHKDVLYYYVHSFELCGQTVLNCMRIFLSAFRLPGEAQQIDRILVAFSEFCHKNCIEGHSGLLENAEVTYLLTFSIIMLNTDRHNPNIRAERKMTMEQFVRNNTNYGDSVKQTRDIPRDYLESLYTSIASYPLRTEKNDISGGLTPEMWMDMQLQTQQNIDKGLLVTTCFAPDALMLFRDSLRKNAGLDALKEGEHALPPTEEDMESCHGILSRYDSTTMSCALYGAHWVADDALVKCFWSPLLATSLCCFVRVLPSLNSLTMDDVPVMRPIPSSISLATTRELLMGLLRILYVYNMQLQIDSVFALLCDVAGFGNGSMLACLSEYLANHESPSLDISLIFSSQAPHRYSLSPGGKNDYIAKLSTSRQARMALRAILCILCNAPQYLGKRGWTHAWHVLGSLRDSHTLPQRLIYTDSWEAEEDLLPVKAREDFVARMVQARVKCISHRQKPKHRPRRSSSIWSWSILGGNGADEEADSEQMLQEERLLQKKCMASVQNGRYDVGYSRETEEEKPSTDVNTTKSNKLKWQAKIRDILNQEGVDQLIADSKFLEENVLCNYITGICKTAEREHVNHLSDFENSIGGTQYINEDIDSSSESTNDALSSWKSALTASLHGLAPPSEACTAWLEMVLVEVVVRNRDRVSAFWSILESHYERSAMVDEQLLYAGASSTLLLYHSLDRRVVGLFKIASRLMGRSQLGEPIMYLIGSIFGIKSSDDTSVIDLSNANKLDMNNKDIDGTESNTSSSEETNSHLMLLHEVAGQVASGLWKSLTQNVSLLPTLSLDAWQSLFDVIAMTSGAGSFATMKSFEILAWLIHEPRLHAEVPMFCVRSLKPLLTNPNAPLSVSVGGVHLLLHLHHRLEALFESTSPSADTSACWLPILQALASGVVDRRYNVRRACADAISTALLDRHAGVVPACALLDIFVDVVLPSIVAVGQFHVHSVQDGTYHLICDEIPETRHNHVTSAAPLQHDEYQYPQGFSIDIHSTVQTVPVTPQHDPSPRDGPSTHHSAPPKRLGSKSSRTGSIAGDLLSVATKVLLQNLSRFVILDNFESLWSAYLSVFGFYLDAPARGYEASLAKNCPELSQATEVAAEVLKNMLSAVNSMGLFGSKDRRSSAWSVMRQELGSLAKAPEISKDYM